jgi:hypothetical protein
MMQGYKNSTEKESQLAWALCECIRKGEWAEIPIEDFGWVESLAKDGFTSIEDGTFTLTKKAKGYLYAYYGKE